jgi:soluble lytic murein transglycosylase-like protein
MNSTTDIAAAADRWADAAALLGRAGRAPSGLRGWLGSAWSGDAARAFDDWATELHRATRLAAGALADAAASARAPHWRWTALRLDAELDALERAVRALTAVRIPGEPPTARVVPVPRAAIRTHHPGTVNGWVAEAVRILRQHGYRADQVNPEHLAMIVRHESAGNPGAVNGWDHNAARGTPSMGLMQTIRPTFDRWHLPGHGDILDPVDNIIAGARYAVARYGSVSHTPGILSLHAGGGYRGY